MPLAEIDTPVTQSLILLMFLDCIWNLMHKGLQNVKYCQQKYLDMIFMQVEILLLCVCN